MEVERSGQCSGCRALRAARRQGARPHQGLVVALRELADQPLGIAHIATHSVEQMLACMDVIMGGVIERFPRLRLAFLEGPTRFSGAAQPLRLEPAHLAGRSSRPGDRPAAGHPAHRRIAAQSIGVVHILVTSQPAEY